VIVPVRDVVAVFAATLNDTVPLPDPLPVPLMVIQGALLVAVQPHPADVAIVKDPEAPAAATDCDTGASEYVQAAAACVTVNV
jgi:hypothetical protein